MANLSSRIQGILNAGFATASAYGLVKGGNVPGKTDGVAVSSGYIGQVLEANSSGSVALSTSYANIASVSLSAGVWLVTGSAQIITGTASITQISIAISLASATVDITNLGNRVEATTGFANNPQWFVGTRVVNVSSNTTVYMTGQIAGTPGTGTWYSASNLRAIRIA